MTAAPYISLVVKVNNKWHGGRKKTYREPYPLRTLGVFLAVVAMLLGYNDGCVMMMCADACAAPH